MSEKKAPSELGSADLQKGLAELHREKQKQESVQETLPPSPGARPQDPLVGRALGEKYRVLRKLGEGGFGAVYEAEEPRLQRKVAIKTLHPHLTRKPAIVERFLQEGIAASKLDHPGAVKIFDTGETPEGHLWLAMEFIAGQTLEQALSQRGKIPPEELLEVLGPLCEILGEAHQKDLVHRDLKPQNIMLVSIGQTTIPKLLDFGIAKLKDSIAHTATEATMGTPGYMAPEQWGEAGKVTPSADVYSLGMILYQMLSGRLPFQATTPQSWMMAHCTEAPAPLAPLLEGHPRAKALEAVVKKALSKEPSERYPTASELKSALEQALSEKEQPLQEEKQALPEKEQLLHEEATTNKAKKTGLLLGALGGAIALAGVLWFSFFKEPTPAIPPAPEPEPATQLVTPTPPPSIPVEAPARPVENIALRFEVVTEDERGEKRFLQAGDTLRSGDKFELRFTVNQPLYVYVLLLSSDGSSGVLLPEEGDLTLEEGTTRLPQTTGDWFILDDVTGYENLYLIASREPIGKSASLLAKTLEDIREGRLRIAKPEKLKSTAQAPRGLGLTPKGIIVGRPGERKAGAEPLKETQVVLDEEEGVAIAHFWLKHRH